MPNSKEDSRPGVPNQASNGPSLTAKASWPTLPQTTTVLQALDRNGDPQGSSARLWSSWGAATGGAHDIVSERQSFRAAIVLALLLGVVPSAWGSTRGVHVEPFAADGSLAAAFP